MPVQSGWWDYTYLGGNDLRYMVEHNFVQVVGTIWLPATTAAMEYTLTPHDVENIGEPTRDNVQDWLDSHVGDFQSIADFRASIGDVEIDWAEEESEFIYNDCVFGCEEKD